MDVCVSVSVCLTIVYVCGTCTLLCRHTCGNQNRMSGASFHHSQLYCNLLLKPEILFRLLGHWYFKISLSFPPKFEVATCTTIPDFLCRCWGFEPKSSCLNSPYSYTVSQLIIPKYFFDVEILKSSKFFISRFLERKSCSWIICYWLIQHSWSSVGW